MMSTQKSFLRKRRAASAVEMAIIAPVLLTVLFGIIEFGWYFMARQIVHHAAAEAARLATLPGYEMNCGGTACDDPELQGRAADLMQDALNVDPGQVTLKRNPATDATDPCESITIWIPTSEVALPGFVLQVTGIQSSNIAFSVTNAHPDYAGVTNSDCQDPPPAP